MRDAVIDLLMAGVLFALVVCVFVALALLTGGN